MRGRPGLLAPCLAVATSCAPVAETPATPPTFQQPAPVFASSSVGLMGHVPGATFRMGSDVGEPDERPAHDANVSAFDMDLTEVTVVQYASCVQARACPPAARTILFPGVVAADHELYDSECNADRRERSDHPINCVDWSMADAYCRWAGKRLPTEPEWEYAACGGNCGDPGAMRTASAAALNRGRWPFSSSVATTPPGPFGLYDMAGNVWEWTASIYCPYDHPDCRDVRRVIRGGSWSLVDFLFVRLTDRSPADPADRNTNVGFRCARSSAAP